MGLVKDLAGYGISRAINRNSDFQAQGPMPEGSDTEYPESTYNTKKRSTAADIGNIALGSLTGNNRKRQNGKRQ